MNDAAIEFRRASIRIPLVIPGWEYMAICITTGEVVGSDDLASLFRHIAGQIACGATFWTLEIKRK